MSVIDRRSCRKAAAWIFWQGARVLDIRMPFPPSVNSYWRNVGGRMVLSAGARKFHDRALCAMEKQIGGRHELFCGPVRVEAVLHPPDRRTRDLDNYLKAMLDACTRAGIWTDDSLVREIRIAFGEVRRPGLARLRIWDIALQGSAGGTG